MSKDVVVSEYDLPAPDDAICATSTDPQPRRSAEEQRSPSRTRTGIGTRDACTVWSGAYPREGNTDPPATVSSGNRPRVPAEAGGSLARVGYHLLPETFGLANHDGIAMPRGASGTAVG
jgi:hypothetical protein